MMKTSEVQEMKIHTPYHPGISSRFVPVIPAPSLANALAAWLDRQQQRIHLSDLDDRMLNDIGVSRSEAVREARRWT